MKYLKVFTDFAGKMKLLGDAERGRLFSAMLLYAETGEDTELKGNERFLWDTAKIEIDRQNDAYKNKVSGAEKARSLINSDIRGNQKQSDRLTLISAQDKDKDKEKEKDKKKDKKTRVPRSPLEKTIEEFKEFRKKIKAPMTDRAVELLCENLEKLAGSNDALKIEILHQSILNGWKGVFAIKKQEEHKSAIDLYGRL